MPDMPDQRFQRVTVLMTETDSPEIDEYVRWVVDAAPPLTAAQGAKLRTLLGTGETVTRCAPRRRLD